MRVAYAEAVGGEGEGHLVDRLAQRVGGEVGGGLFVGDARDGGELVGLNALDVADLAVALDLTLAGWGFLHYPSKTVNNWKQIVSHQKLVLIYFLSRPFSVLSRRA